MSADYDKLARELYPVFFPRWFRVLMRPWREKFLALSAARARAIESRQS